MSNSQNIQHSVDFKGQTVLKYKKKYKMFLTFMTSSNNIELLYFMRQT